MLTAGEIASWDKTIERSGDPTLIRKFYPRTGKPERVTEAFRSAAKNLAGFDTLLQKKFEDGAYKPELSDDDVKEIAVGALREDIGRKRVGDVFRKMSYPVYATALPDDELRDLVNTALREGAQGYGPGTDPANLIEGLVEAPDMSEDSEESSFAFWILQDEHYRELADPALVRNVVTVRICHEIILGRFSTASEIKAKFPAHCDEPLVQHCIAALSTHPEFQERYGWAYLIVAFRSEFKQLFAAGQDPRISTASKIANFIDGSDEVADAEMDGVVASVDSDALKKLYSERKDVPYEKSPEQMSIDQLHGVFDEAEDMFGILSGIRSLNELLGDEAYIQSVGGEEKVRDVVQARIAKALEDNKPDVVYSLLYGTTLGKGFRMAGVSYLQKYVSVDRAELLGKMTGAVNWNADELLSDEYDFSCDNLTFGGTSEVDNAYELYVSLRDTDQDKLPSAEEIKKLVFLKMAMQMKETYEGTGMRTIVSVYEDPKNAPYIDNDKMKKLLTKVFDDYFERGRVGGFVNSDLAAHFYTLASSKMGELVKDDKRLEPYFKLHAFLQSNPDQA